MEQLMQFHYVMEQTLHQVMRHVQGDCNSSGASVNPGATEICGNSIDDNCNGQTDEGMWNTSSIFTMWVAVASFSTNVLADLVTGATQYRFEVSRGATVYEYTNTSSNFFRFGYLNFFRICKYLCYDLFSSCKIFKSGVWSDYGNSCNVITPDVPLTQGTSFSVWYHISIFINTNNIRRYIRCSSI